MTELQKLELDMLREVLRITELLGIKCFLVCGSALGAVKYKGFIPWDDDIDVGMFRDDYERFCKEAQKNLSEPYFLQTYKSDPVYPLIFAKLRNSQTTYIESSIHSLNINHGVYIDIFPLDLYPKKRLTQHIFEIKKWYYTHLLATVYETKRTLPGEIIRRFNLMLGVDKRIPKLIKKYERLLTAYNNTDSQIVCNHGNWQGKLEYTDKSQYGKGAGSLFEGLAVKVPEKFDEYLTRKYGDWRSDPPEKEQRGHHFYEKMDLQHSYTDYITVLSDRKISVKDTSESNSI